MPMSDHTCTHLDPALVLRATTRSFALKVRGQTMVGADIFDGDIVIGDFTPEVHPGQIVVALVDGETEIRRYVVHEGRPLLIAENPASSDSIPLSELVVQGVVHTVVHRLR